MLEASRQRILATVPDDALVLDVGGWAKPFERADWVLDALPYATRGLYGYDRDERAPHERFDASRWVVRDMCDHEPWPFADGQFDFAICSHTLEDVRDPVWVCRELMRVAKAGYVEVPDRREEQTYGIHGPFVGWSHHRWLVDVRPDGIDVVVKTRDPDVNPALRFPRAAYDRLGPDERVQQLWFDGPFAVRERLIVGAEDMAAYLAEAVPPGGAAAERVAPLSRPAKARLVAEVLADYVAARRLMRSRPLPETLARMRDVDGAGARAAGPVSAAEARRLGRVVVRVISRLPDAKCLLRSLVLTRMLARRGTPAQLVLGVRPGAAFAAHAWVELDGEPVLPAGDFQRLGAF